MSEEVLPTADMLILNMPSYVNTDMQKMLPQEILSKQGKRVYDNTKGSLIELLSRHVNSVEEINDLASIAKGEQENGNFGGY
jgi:hypothetical protein